MAHARLRGAAYAIDLCSRETCYRQNLRSPSVRRHQSASTMAIVLPALSIQCEVEFHKALLECRPPRLTWKEARAFLGWEI